MSRVPCPVSTYPRVLVTEAQLYTHRLVDLAPAARSAPGARADGAEVDGAGAVATSDGAGEDAAGAVRVCGRVVIVDAGGLVLDDGTGACRFPLPAVGAAGAPQAGDFVCLELPVARRGEAPRTLAVLQRPLGRRSSPEFPSASGEWYRLHRDADLRLRRLTQRAAALSEIRRFFASRDFLEIEAPLVVPSPGLELHLQAFAVSATAGVPATDAPADLRYLITSPEYQLKRLLCGGLSRIYSLGKVFRHGEAGPHHNPEFTMLEWYRAYAGWESVAADVEALCAGVAQSLRGTPVIEIPRPAQQPLAANSPPAPPFRIDLTPPWERMTVSEAIERHTGVHLRGNETVPELLAVLPASPSPSTIAAAQSHLAKRDPAAVLPDATATPPDAAAAPPDAAAADLPAWDDLFFSFFLDHVEPHLGHHRPVILHDWPRPLCALARPRPDAPHVVERFEAYAGGLELCNGFGELCDPVEQARRFSIDLAERARRGLPAYPIDQRFLDALCEGLPPSGGVALGVDRLLMLVLGASTITEVLPFAFSEV